MKFLSQKWGCFALGLTAPLLFSVGMAAAQTADIPAPSPEAELGVEAELAPDIILNDPLSEVVSVICPFKDEIDYEPGRVTCGFITVPENREVPDSRMVRLAFAKIVAEGRLEDEDEDESTSEDEEPIVVRDDPVAYLTGGPGVSINPYVSRFLEHDLTKTRDLYILNQRGIGDSEEICPFYGQTRREQITATTTEQRERESTQRLLDCFEYAKARGIDIRGYNTVENARDVRALRRALGYESWNVWGISYGSHLGQMLVNIDPEGIEALVLDAIVPNDLVDLMRLHRWIERDFNLIFDECERQDAKICEGLEEDLNRIFKQLVETPLTIEALDEELYPAGSVTLPAAVAAFLPFQMMYEQDQHPAIPAVMKAMVRILDEPDAEKFKGFTNLNTGGGEDSSSAMGALIRCNDGYVAATAEIAAEDLAENPRFAGEVFTVAGSQAAAQACVDAGVGPRDRADYQLIQTDLPTLIINGDWDPITPPDMAERIAPGFSNGRLIIVPYAGHGPTRSMSECGAQVMTDFFDDPSQDLSALDATCLEEGVEPPKYLNYLQTNTTIELASLAAEDPKRVVPPVVQFVLLTLTILVGLVAIVFGFIARRFAPIPYNMPSAGPARPRAFATFTALTSLTGLALIGVGGAAAYEIAEVSLVAGFAPPARLGATLVMIGGVLGLMTLILAIFYRDNQRIRLRTTVGLPLVGLAALLLAVFLIRWDLAPW
ncbi:MAG: alpha/beta fold hydrolase [Pseudomonadota bacterium]